jgi:metal-sulfur cluster biosynthetic enzyme
MLSEERVVELLRPVEDPELGYSIVDLGLLRGVEIDAAEARVRIRMTFTTPACPLAPEIMQAMRDELIAVEEISKLEVAVEWEPPWDPARDATEEIRADFGIWT